MKVNAARPGRKTPRQFGKKRAGRGAARRDARIISRLFGLVRFRAFALSGGHTTRYSDGRLCEDWKTAMQKRPILRLRTDAAVKIPLPGITIEFRVLWNEAKAEWEIHRNGTALQSSRRKRQSAIDLAGSRT